MRYFHPKSVTWWSGVVSIAAGVVTIISPEQAVIAELVAAFTGAASASPAMLISLGMGLIGIRDKMERG